MAAVCEICGKGPGFGHNVPWSKKKTNRRWNPNIQRVHAVVDGTAKRRTGGGPGLTAATGRRCARGPRPAPAPRRGGAGCCPGRSAPGIVGEPH